MKVLAFCPSEKIEATKGHLQSLQVFSDIYCYSSLGIIDYEQFDIFWIGYEKLSDKVTRLIRFVKSVGKRSSSIVYSIEEVHEHAHRVSVQALELGAHECLYLSIMGLQEQQFRIQKLRRDQAEKASLNEDKNILSAGIMTDRLTGLFNRTMFDHALEVEISRYKRQHIPVSLLFLDIDHFKGVNDTYGHSIGDHVLRLVAQGATESVRDFDLVCRYGGEEFAIIMPGAQLGDAQKVAERIRGKIESIPAPSLRGPQKVTASIGVSCVENFEAGSLTSAVLLDDADSAMYKAKKTGRNCVSCNRDLDSICVGV